MNSELAAKTVTMPIITLAPVSDDADDDKGVFGAVGVVEH
jgi:hypothetical protein